MFPPLSICGFAGCIMPAMVSSGQGSERLNAQLMVDSLPASLQEALLEGCWEAFEDQYFDCFSLADHVIEREAVSARNWWPYWVGMDYGFRHACVAYLFTKAPD